MEYHWEVKRTKLDQRNGLLAGCIAGNTTGYIASRTTVTLQLLLVKGGIKSPAAGIDAAEEELMEYPPSTVRFE